MLEGSAHRTSCIFLDKALLVQVGRVKTAGGPGCWLVLDGAHTGASAAALADTLRSAFPRVRLLHLWHLVIMSRHRQKCRI